MPDQNSASRRSRRANGTGTEPRWIAERGRWQLQVTMPDGKRHTLRHADKAMLEFQRDLLVKEIQQMRQPAYERPWTRKPRRDRGSGSGAWWNEERQQFEAKITLSDGRRKTLRAATREELEARRDALTQQIRKPESSPDANAVYWVMQMLLENNDFLDRIAEKVAERLDQ